MKKRLVLATLCTMLTISLTVPAFADVEGVSEDVDVTYEDSDIVSESVDVTGEEDVVNMQEEADDINAAIDVSSEAEIENDEVAADEIIEAELPGSNINNPQIVTLGESGTKEWSYQSEQKNYKYYLKVVLEEDGILSYQFLKQGKDDNKFQIDIRKNVFPSFDCIWSGGVFVSRQFQNMAGNAYDYGSVGLKKGEYIVAVIPNLTIGQDEGFMTQYTFNFEPTSFAEKEPNEDYTQATKVQLGKEYTGYMGCNGIGNSVLPIENNDYYAVQMEKGRRYRFDLTYPYDTEKNNIHFAFGSKYLSNMTVKDGVSSCYVVAEKDGTNYLKMEREPSLNQIEIKFGFYPYDTYQIKYELDGGTNSKKNPTEYTSDSGVLKFEAPMRKHFTFEGWYLDSDFKTKIDSVKKGAYGDLTLYAKFVKKTYTIKFKGNGSTSGSVSNMTCDVGTSYKLSVNKYKKKGYMFKGWCKNKKGKGKLYDAKSVFNETIALAEDGSYKDVVLYAIWSKGEGYTVVFNPNKGEGYMTDQMVKRGKEVKLKNNEFTKRGYKLSYWTTKEDGKGKKYKNKAKIKNLAKANGTVNLYANWEKIEYTVKFNRNGADSGKNTSHKVKYGQKVFMPNSYGLKLYKKGYSLTGWNTSKKGKDHQYLPEEEVKNLSSRDNDVVTFYAQWKPNTYEIRFFEFYEENGKNKKLEGEMKPLTKVTYDREVTLRKNGYTRPGYTFKGWNTKYNGKGKTYKDKERVKNLVPRGFVYLYTMWDPITYNICFVGNRSTSGSMKSIAKVKYDKKITLTANSFKKKGYKFKGWNTKADGTGIHYDNKQKVQKLSTVQGDNFALYAEWEKKE